MDGVTPAVASGVRSRESYSGQGGSDRSLRFKSRAAAVDRSTSRAKKQDVSPAAEVWQRSD